MRKGEEQGRAEEEQGSKDVVSGEASELDVTRSSEVEEEGFPVLRPHQLAVGYGLTRESEEVSSKPCLSQAAPLSPGHAFREGCRCEQPTPPGGAPAALATGPSALRK